MLVSDIDLSLGFVLEEDGLLFNNAIDGIAVVDKICLRFQLPFEQIRKSLVDVASSPKYTYAKTLGCFLCQ